MNSKPVLMRMLVILGIVSLAFLAGCGDGTPSGSNPTATITTISPNSALAGGAAFTLTINGTNFVAASMVSFGGTARTTTFVSATQLTAAIPAAAIASASTAAVTVTNPAPGGGTSNAVNFTISSGTNPIPVINSLDPSSAAVEGPAFTLAVKGSNFVSSSVVRWNGSDRPTAFVNSSEIHAQISASDIAATGSAAVTVINPAPGGGTSNSLTVSILAVSRPFSVAVAPDPSNKFGKFAYVLNNQADSVSMYMIDPTTGALTPIGPPVAADHGPYSGAVHPSGKFVYVTNHDADDVSMYTINATTGALTSIGTIATGSSPTSIAIDPSGKFAYVTNNQADNISMYTINPTTGALEPIGTVLAGGPAISVTVHPSGKFAYVANVYPQDNVSTYTINATTGALTSVGTIAAGSTATSGTMKIAIDRSGKFAYVASDGCALDTFVGNVSMYTIDLTTGALTPIGPPVAADWCADSVTVDPSGKFVYVTNNQADNVSMYTINATTGALTSIGTIATGSSPTSIAIDPSGNFAYVTNSGSNSVSMYSIDAATGALTLIGTIGA